MSDQFGGRSGNAPMPGEPPPSPVARGVAPASVANAVRLMFVRAAIGVVGLIVLVATKDTLKDQIASRNKSLDASELDTAVNFAVVFGLVVTIIFLVAYVLLALKVRDGRNWARIVTWVLAAIGVLSVLASLAQPAPALSRVVSLISGVVDVAIIVLLAQRPSNEYFRSTI